jgi:DNA-binding CsgD family transcriptional regulator
MLCIRDRERKRTVAAGVLLDLMTVADGRLGECLHGTTHKVLFDSAFPLRFNMRRPEPKSDELPTYVVLVTQAGEIVDVRAHHQQGVFTASRLKGRSYADQCAPRYRAAIKGLLNRQRQLLSAVMPPPTLEADTWFAVVGVPIGPSKDGGALFVHMDISPWVALPSNSSLVQSDVPSEISFALLQQAIATTFVPPDAVGRVNKSRDYDGIEALTSRQREVLVLIGTGKTNVEIAEALSCSLNTVKRHVTAVLQKLKLPNRTRASMLANRLNLTSLDVQEDDAIFCSREIKSG